MDDFASRLALMIRVVEPSIGGRMRFANAISASAGMVTNWCQGKRQPSAVYQFRIQERYSISMKYLSTGLGEMFISPSSPETNEISELPRLDGTSKVSYKSVPLFTCEFDSDSKQYAFKPMGNERHPLKRKPVKDEIGFVIPYAVPHTSFKKDHEVTCDLCEIEDLITGDIYVFECEIGVVVSRVYRLEDGRILIDIEDEFDYVPTDISRIFHFLPPGQNPYLEVEFTKSEKESFERRVQEFLKKEKQAKVAYKTLQTIILLPLMVPITSNAAELASGNGTDFNCIMMLGLTFILCLIGHFVINPMRRWLRNIRSAGFSE